jgi:ABC-type nitrate/sulfonate/bicarbonate transport system permease component
MTAQPDLVSNSEGSREGAVVSAGVWRNPVFWQYAFGLCLLASWVVASRLLPSYLVPGPIEVFKDILQLVTIRKSSAR